MTTDEPKPPIADPIAPGPPPLSPGAMGDAVMAPRAQTSPSPPRAKPTSEYKDGSREIVETIVFVVVLVLLLKTFLAEAFVIPTGSMATTLLGYHRDVKCDMCGYHHRVNASDEVERKPRYNVVGYTCPNCDYHKRLLQPQFGVPGGGEP